MTSQEGVRYRLRLAAGFLDEARQDCASTRWRSCVDNSQLAVENAAKALLAVLGPVGRTHRPAVFLREAMADGRFTPAEVPSVEKVAACAEELGHDIHARSDYGDETDFRTPWEIFGEEDGREALAIAEVAVFQAGLVAEGVDRR